MLTEGREPAFLNARGAQPRALLLGCPANAGLHSVASQRPQALFCYD